MEQQMSKVHDAMRHLEKMELKEAPEDNRGKALSSLIGALLADLADELSDEPQLETVRADLVAASLSYEGAKKKDLTLRFYLAFRSMLHAHESLRDRLRHAEKRIVALEAHKAPIDAVAEQKPDEGSPAGQMLSTAAGAHSG